MNRTEKKLVVKDLNETFNKASVVLLTGFNGINVSTITDLRRSCRENNVNYRVVKNTLAKLALKETNLEGLSEYFRGPTAIAWSENDPVAPAKVLTEFAKSNDKFTFKTGYLEGNIIDEQGIKELSKLPGINELRAQLLSVMNGVPTQFVRLLTAVPQNFVNLLNAYKEKLEKEPKVEATSEEVTEAVSESTGKEVTEAVSESTSKEVTEAVSEEVSKEGNEE